ncbi:MAG: hypothetical protein QNJ40_17810 [Xanthomonadales bacterium]|nr:hypothetical protein [Xanthomonadales bacterium]
MMPSWEHALVGLVCAGVICLALHYTLKDRGRWMMATLLVSFVYLVLSLRLEQMPDHLWLDGLRWGLFASALFCFIRFRRSPKA